MSVQFDAVIHFDETHALELIINFGKTATKHVTHTIEQPRHIWVKRTEKGADESLEIEGQGNQKTLLTFRSPIQPEFVDGVV